jgi:kynurenine formamidase
MCSASVVREASDAGSSDGKCSLAPVPVHPRVLSRYREVLDLTHVVTPDFPVFPGDRRFESREWRLLERHGYAQHELRFSEHTGTHLDAPAHFFADGATAETIAADRLVVPLAVVSIAERAAHDHDALVTPDDLLAWEARHGRMPAGAVVAMHSGWAARLPDGAAYLNQDAAGVMHTPGFGAEAAELLVHEREVAGIAVDTLSLDRGASSDYEAHRVVLGAGRYGLENVAGLALLPPAGATLVVGGPKHRGATGGPARLLALF